MFFNRLMGASEANQGEVVTKVKDNLWQSSRGTLYWLVEPELCQSSTGVYYRKAGLNVYGSDGNWFSSLDVFDEQKKVSTPTSKNSQSQSQSGCLSVLLLLAVAVLFLVFR